MSHKITTLLLVGVVAGSTTAFAAARRGSAGAEVAEQAPMTQTANHAVRGVVKSVSATSLVITRSRGRRSDLAFVLNSSTLREGTIAVGSTVSVRYRSDGNTLVATAVIARSRTGQ